jgi:hypothetical protein
MTSGYSQENGRQTSCFITSYGGYEETDRIHGIFKLCCLEVIDETMSH